jgi:hypothetical protein
MVIGLFFYCETTALKLLDKVANSKRWRASLLKISIIDYPTQHVISSL